MRLARLVVQRFQCIESAELELGPGLNVLYGPNDLGKSSLAWAIRAVLLLQHNSAQHERFVSWYGGGEPRVALTFVDGEHRYWRVTKSFGATAGRSTLETSKDGRTFTPDVTGRQVDEKLRAMMRWGIPAPGGSGGTRGMPASFLTQVLLAEQASVREVLFDTNLAGDPDETGRHRLVEALGALAQDPLFKRVLDSAQDRVDEAFTPTGKKKRTAGSPWKAQSDRVKELHRERDELAGKLRDTEVAETRIRELTAERDHLVEDVAEAQRELAAAERDFGVQQQRQAIATALAAHEAVIAAAAQRAERITAHTEGLGVARQKLADLGERATAAAAALETAARARDAARAELDRLAHDDAQGERVKAGLEDAIRVAAEALAGAVADERRATDEQVRARELARQIGELERDQAALASTSARAGRERELWTAVAIAAVGRLRTEEQALRGKLPKQVPAAAAIAELRDLREQLRIAEAKLEVGLAVRIRPQRALAIKTRRDGGKETTSKGGEPRTVSAKRSIALVIDDLVELDISAGDETAREELAALQARWDATGGTLLAAHGVDALEALEALRVQAEDHARLADDKRRAAEQLERATATLDKPELDEDDEAEVASRLGKLKPDVAAKLTERLAELERSAADSSKQLVLETRLATLRAALDGAVGEAAAGAPKGKRGKPAEPRDPLAARTRAVTEASERRLAAKAAHEAATQLLLAWKREREAIVKVARDQLATAETAAAAAKREADARAGHVRQATDLFNQVQLELTELTATQAATNVAAAAAEVAALAPQLAALGPAGALEATDVENLRQRAARLERRMRETEAEMHKARGALEQVGGAIVRERQRELDGAITLAEEREGAIAIEYDAWKLLVDTLRESEATEGAHLGKALGGPVSQRFRELTGGRYGELELGANLESAGLTVAGQLRDPATLSAGTQDQLATLLRLCVAEQLKSSIVLDDHLAQSDLGRVSWFNTVLRGAAEQIQIVFLTCRPGELLAPGELPTGADAARNLAGGRVRAIDLTRVIQRYRG